MSKSSSKRPLDKASARKPAGAGAKARVTAKPKRRGRVAVVVLGMHRSGTSALAGTLNLLGCDLPATPMGKTDENPKGYFESALICQMHTRLLASAGSRWDDWLPLSAGWYRSARAEEFHEQAVQVLGEEFGTARLFVLKDPRVCRLLPFWEDVLNTADVAPHYVLTHRNPLEVAASLEKRDGMDPGTGLLLWLRHVLDAEADSRGKPRSIVNYVGLLENWAGVMQKIQDDTGLVLPRMGVAAAPEVDSFLDDNLRRNAESPVRVLQNPLLSDWVRDTYEIMERWVAEGESGADYKALDAIRDWLAGAGTTFAPVIEASRKTAHALKQERARRAEEQEKLAQASLAHDTLAQERDAARAELSTLSTEVEKARAEATAARSQVENLTVAYEAAQTRADELQSRTLKLELDLDHATQQREALEGARSDLEQHLTDVAGERDKIRARIKTLEREQADAETARAGLSADVDRLEAEKDSAAEKIDALEAALAQSKSALAQREEETDQLHSELGRLREEHDAQLEQLEAETGTLRHQLSERVVQVSTLESRSKSQSTEVARITAMLLEAEEALANAETRAEARLADLTAQNESKLKRLQERSKAQLAEAEARIAELKSRGDYAEAAYESIRHSTSWRITRPLRAVIRSLRGR